MGLLTGIIALLLLIGCLALAGGCSGQSNSPPPVVVSAKGIQSLDRAAIRTMLKRLADAPPPKELSSGAMCYDVAELLDRVEYVCPKCGERTLYDDSKLEGKKRFKEDVSRIVGEEIPSCRREMTEIRKLAGDVFVLDESQFCRKCSPTATEPKLVLHITYENGKIRDIEKVTAFDLQLLREFIGGSAVHKNSQDWETPLKDSLPRLQELLGVELEK